MLAVILLIYVTLDDDARLSTTVLFFLNRSLCFFAETTQ